MMLPGGLTAYSGFHAGGFFAGTPAVLAVALALILTVRILVADDPLAGISPGIVLAAGALGVYAIWTLISAHWSGTPAGALSDFDRILLYLLLLVFVGSFPRDARRLRWLVRWLVAGIGLVCMAAFISRTLPQLLRSAPTNAPGLSYPVTYSNALGLLAALATILCLGLGANEHEPRPLRVMEAAILPVLGVTLMLTFSRGAVAAGIVGVVALTALARPRLLLSQLLATVPTTAVAVSAAYQAHALASDRFVSPAGVAQGHRVALVVGVCVLSAALARAAGMQLLDDRLVALHISTRARVRLMGTAMATVIVALLATGVIGDLPTRIERQYTRFVQGNVLLAHQDPRTRFTDPGNDGRLYFWRVALAAFRDSPLRGAGAGSFETYWSQHRPADIAVIEAHSLYLEALGELGVVGLALVVLAVVTILLALALRARIIERALYGALLSAALAWALHAGVDWDWEMPVTTLGFFAIGGAVLAAPAGSVRRLRPPVPAARLVIGFCTLLLAIVPATVAMSQANLDTSARAFARGDCERTVGAALASISALGSRPEPYELISYCDARGGRRRLAVQMMDQAIARDPRDWRLHYGLAVVLAAGRQDPCPAAHDANRLNPLGQLAADGVRRFCGGSPDARIRRARSAALPLQ